MSSSTGAARVAAINNQIMTNGGVAPSVGGSTALSTAAGASGNPSDNIGVISPTSLTAPTTPTIPTPPPATGSGTDAMSKITAQIAALQTKVNDATSAGYASTDTVQYDPKTGNIVPKAQTATDTTDTSGQSRLQTLLSKFLPPPSTADLYTTERANAGVDSKQALVNQYQNELTGITNKAAADKLALTGEGRGIPEPIIGGQQAEIDKEAAIRALPVATQLAAAQGDLKLAQDHLDTYFKLKVEDAQAQVDYNNKIVQAVYDYATQDEKNQLDAKTKQQSINLTEYTNAVNYSQQLGVAAMNAGKGQIMTDLAKLPQPDVNSKTFASDLANYNAQVARLAGGIVPIKVQTFNNQVVGTAGAYEPVDVAAIQNKNAGQSQWGGLSYNGLFNAASLYNSENGKMPSLGLGQSGDVKKARTAVVNYAGQLADALGLTTPQMSALYKADSKAATDIVSRVAKIDATSNTLANQFPRLATLADTVKSLGITESDVQSGAAQVKSKFGSTDAASYIELIQTVRGDYAAMQAAIGGSRGGQFFSQTAQQAIPLGLTGDQYRAIQQTILLSAANSQKGTQDEANRLINSISKPSTTGGTSGLDLTNQFDSLFKQYGGQ